MSGKQYGKKREVTKVQEVKNVGEIENDLPMENKMKKVVAEVMQSEFSGPIPPPSIIEGYERVLPGSADRIITMAEKQAAHRQALEVKMVYSEARDGLLGVIFAFLLGIGCIAAAIVMVYLVPQNGGAIAGALLGVTGIGSITSSFITSTRRNNSNKKNEDRLKDTK